MLLGLSGAILLGVLITPRFKISMHLLALGGVWGAWMGSGGLDRAGRLAQGLLHFGWEVVELHRGLFWREMALLTLPVLAAGWVGSARVALGVHRPVEVYVGWGLGALWMALIMAFNLN
jgi:membrane-associated phospholipid phosphatase